MNNEVLMTIMPWLSLSAFIFFILGVYKHQQLKKLESSDTYYSVYSLYRTHKNLFLFKLLIRVHASFVIAMIGIFSKEHTAWLTASWLLLGFGIGLALIGHLYLSMGNQFLSSYVKTTAGSVAGAYRDAAVRKYRNIVNYTVDGVTYKLTDKKAVNSDTLLPIGSLVLVHYNSLNPKDSYIGTELKESPRGLWTLLPVGVVVAIVGIVMAAIGLA